MFCFNHLTQTSEVAQQLYCLTPSFNPDDIVSSAMFGVTNTAAIGSIFGAVVGVGAIIYAAPWEALTRLIFGVEDKRTNYEVTKDNFSRILECSLDFNKKALKVAPLVAAAHFAMNHVDMKTMTVQVLKG